ncbi:MULTISPECIES: hypothetical protein [unclassified Caballeronia]|uniref:hypothetical protein n=1 Tax=unclassified Caballeronia TaxID=2646786 RepID=UPI002854E722|nr:MULTISPECIES: hypothetical protein [unclassified Caballeronia]MDR5817329.1 hypothetical protein [Caballeronia sp. LZ033]MDR5824241.1 hypothetical protein [Caballeronia sp. LZ043]MDR5882135.1 hypothetical protein [Caballeronia sp. LZ032]
MSNPLQSLLRLRHVLGASALSLLLAACGTTSDITAGPQPNSYTVTGKATGTRMSWATARKAAMDAATDYCKQRSQRVSVKSEATSGVRSLEEQTAKVSFTCVPDATTASGGVAPARDE